MRWSGNGVVRCLKSRGFAGSACLLAVCYCVGSACDAARYHFGSEARDARITVESTVHELGRIQGTGDHTCDFTLENTGRQPLVVYGVRPDCSSCVEVKHFPQRAILPGDTGRVTLVLHAGKLEGSVNKKVVVQSNDPARPRVALEIHADVLPSRKSAT